MPTICFDWENPTYKGGWLGIRLARRGGMNKNTPTSGLATRWPHLQLLLLRIGCGDSLPNVNPLNTGRTGYPGLVVSKGLGADKLPLLNAFMLSPRGECRTTVLGGTGDRLNPGAHRMKLERSRMALSTPILTGTGIFHGCMWL